MDPITSSVVLLAVVTGASEAAGGQLLSGLASPRSSPARPITDCRSSRAETACAAAAKLIVDGSQGRKRRRQEDQPEPEPPPPAPTDREGGFPWKKSAAAVGAVVAAGYVVVKVKT
jgi:hypothetical protein